LPIQTLAVFAIALLFAAVPARAERLRIVALGDSLTAGYGLEPAGSFTVQLEAALKARGHDIVIVNAGVSGDTSSDGFARVDWSVGEDADAVIVELGANDALMGLNPAATKAALEKIITGIQARGLPILLAGMEAPRNLGKDYVEAFGALYQDLAERHGVIFYPFFLDGVALDEKLTFPDGMHPNAEGVAKIVEGILPKVEELLARVEAKS
jgi:acyl-CoA thioesterase-1